MLQGESYQGRTYKCSLQAGKSSPFGTFPQLEDQMCEWVPGVDKSPDRIDTHIWMYIFGP
jgi:phage terminase large subunit-like protein